MYIVDDVDAAATRAVRRLTDPQVALRLTLLQPVIVVVELVKLVWYDIGVRQEVKLCLAMLLLHFGHIDGKFVFAGDLERLREVVDLLVLV